MGSSHTPEVVDGPLAVADVPGGHLVAADSCRSHMQEVAGDLYRKCSFCERFQQLLRKIWMAETGRAQQE